MKEVLIVSAENENFPTWSFREWDLKSGSLMHTHPGDPCPANGLACCSPSRTVLASSVRRPQFRVFTAGCTDGSDCPAVVSCIGKIESIAYSTHSDNQMLVLASGCTLQLWELSSGWKSRDLCGHNQTVTKALFTGNDRFIVSGGKDGLILIWDVSRIFNSLEDVDPELTLTHHLMPITDIYACGPCSPFLVWSCSLDKTCQLIDVSTGTIRTKLELPCTPLCVCCSSSLLEVFCGCNDGSILVMPRKEMMQFRQDKSKMNTLLGHKAPVVCIAMSLCGSFLASGGLDKQVRLWDNLWKQCIRIITQPGAVTAISFLTYCESDDGKLNPRKVHGTATVPREQQNVICLPSLSRKARTKKIRMADLIFNDDESEDSTISKLEEELSILKKKMADMLSDKLSEIQC